METGLRVFGPEARYGHALAFDALRGRVVLFGGYEAGRFLDDTWEWDGTQWVKSVAALAPESRQRHALAYDSARGRVVLFGGSGASGPLDDTWAWDGVAWKQATTEPGAIMAGGTGASGGPAGGRGEHLSHH